MNELLPRHPRRVADLPTRRTDHGAVVEPGVVLNPTALALWELCDGRTTVEEMVSAVEELFALDPVRARADVEHAIASMRTAGVLR